MGYATALRHALFAHIQSLGFSEMDTIGTSTLITRMTSDINLVQSGLNMFLRLFLRSPFVVIGAMVCAFTVNVQAALIFVVTIPALSVVVFSIMAVTHPLYKKVQGKLDKVLGLTRENLTGVRVIRAFGKEASETQRFEETNGGLTTLQLKVGHLSALTNPLTYVLINLAIVALLYTGAIEINVGRMASGDLIALVNYMNQILVELVKLANLIVQISKAVASAGRVQAILNTRPGMAFPQVITGKAPARDGDAVRFDHVGLTYAGAGAPSLTGITFTARRGETIGVIGGTGAGKSSLVNLIPRFYDATDGAVELFGRPASAWPREMLRSRVGIVMQKAQLFTGTIRSNLLWGNRSATDAAAAPPTPTCGRLWKLLRPLNSSGPSLWAWTSRWSRAAGTSRAASAICHRRRPPEGHRRPARQHDRLYRQPAGRQPPARRPDSGAGRRPHGGLRHPQRTAGALPRLSGNL